MAEKTDLELQLDGFRLTTAKIYYRFPDFPSILQTYIWQKYDKAPDFPEMFDFLQFWDRNLEGKIHSVEFMHPELISPAAIIPVKHEFRLH